MYKATVKNETFEVDFSEEKGLKGTINGAPFDMDFVDGEQSKHLIYDNKSYSVALVDFNKEEKSCVIRVNNREILVNVKDRFDALLEQLGMDNLNSQKVNEVKAPMPGLVIDVLVEVGAEVKKGDGLLVLEAMKMENILKSPTDGIIKSIEVSKSVAVEKNQVLVSFE